MSVDPALATTPLVIVPTYNEADNVPSLVGRLRRAVPAAHVLIADDNSPDGTGRIADTLAAADDHVHVLHRRGKEGLGAAYLAGFGWGLDRGYGILVECDADGSHAPEELPRLLHALSGADMVKGSRWVRGGRLVNWPRSRELLSRGASVWVRMWLGIGVKDSTGGYNAFHARTLRGLELDDIASAGYCFQVELTWRAVRNGFSVAEVPITFVEREHGASKMGRAIVIEAMIRTALWGLEHRVGQLQRLLTGGVHRARRLRGRSKQVHRARH